ncbi:MAG: N-formylglutamate amidohydrolase [Sphingopyxis sp.]
MGRPPRLVGDGGAFALNPASAEEAWIELGSPRAGGVLIVGDHASNHVPPDIDLGIAPELLNTHIALDIGVAEVAAMLVAAYAVDVAVLGGVSRLVIDCNREAHAPAVIPISSDGHSIAGNAISHDAHQARIARFYQPYHRHITEVIAEARPAMIVSLHSFTSALSAHPNEARPWDIGILYNEDDRLARVAIPAFAAFGLNVGDQQPYSGKLLNHTMNRHAESAAIAYLGIEMRQDRVAEPSGQARFADMIGQTIGKCRHHLAQMGA